MLKYFMKATCNECGQEITAEYLPAGWETSPVGADVHFCSAKCMASAMKRIDDAYAMVFGRYLNDKEVTALRKTIAAKETQQ